VRKPQTVRLWTCDVCGKVGTWGPGWLWFPAKRTNKYHDPEPGMVVCSERCRLTSPCAQEPVLDR
jgi:hypothetical protein